MTAMENMKDAVAQEEHQVKLRELKLEEQRARFCGASAQSFAAVEAKKLYEYEAYQNVEELPEGPVIPKVQMDFSKEALLVPVCGSTIPFHARTIKNMSRSQDGNGHWLRVNFFIPGQGKNQEDYPIVQGRRAYVKELTFKAATADNFESVVSVFKQVQKHLKQKDTEGDTSTSTTIPEGLKLDVMRSGFPVLRDLNMRPTIGHGSKRTIGTLEAHMNGFRFSLKGSSEKVEIFYAQIKHAIFEPCQPMSLIVVIHLHLREPMMLGKKRTQDVQFFTQITEQSEDLSQMRKGSALDPDELYQEQREREMKARLNKAFDDFAKKAQSIKGSNLKFDIPYAELRFEGVPNKSQVPIVPGAECLVALQEWPPFCVSLQDIDVVVFERATNLALREFDMVLVKKNYNEMPVRITMVPKIHLHKIKQWLHSCNVVFYALPMNMCWQMVMKTVADNPVAFVEQGGWSSWFNVHESSDTEEDNQSGSDFTCDESDDDEASDAVDDAESDFSVEEESDAEDDDDSEEGESWDALEEKAARDDKRTAEEARRKGRGEGVAPPVAKRRRR